MRASLRSLLQPSLEMDFDGLYDDFVREHGREDPRAFVDHLSAFGLISYDVAQAAHEQIKAPPKGTPRVGMLRSATPAPASPVSRPSRGTPPPTQPRLSWPAMGEEPRRRTLFRRASDGSLAEADSARPAAPREAVPPPDGNGRYTFAGIVGEGAMGRVHVARDAHLRRRVAFKQLGEDAASEAALAAKFSSEARITAQLDHPNIVPVYELTSETAYTMKLVEGRTLQDIIAEAREDAIHSRPERHTLNSLLDLFLKVGDAISYAHSRGVLHRDLKPENVMVGAFNQVYVMDWGIARPLDGSVDVDSVPDEGDLIMGTPGYMSPEQADGRNAELTSSSDEYALGLLLFELVALRPAVTGKTALAQVMRHQDGEMEPLVHAAGKRIPRELVGIIRKATQKSPADRYPSVQGLTEDIRDYLRGAEVSAAPDGPLQRVSRWMANHREATTAGITLFSMAAVVLIFAVITLSRMAVAASEGRQQRLSTVVAAVARQASVVDGQFVKVEGLVSVLGTSAVDHLFSGNVAPDALRPATSYDAPGAGGAIPSDHYRRPIDLEHLAYIHPAANETAGRQVASLGPLRRRFYEVLLRSHSEEAATWTSKRAQRAVAEVGLPAAWTWVGTEAGAYVVFPGHGGFEADFDIRKAPSYRMALDHRGPIWGAAAVDPSGIGLVLSCGQGLFDADDQPIGVAGIDITFDTLRKEFLTPEEFVGRSGVVAHLLDPDGRVVVSSADTEDASPPTTVDLPLFGEPSVVQAVKERRTGFKRGLGSNGDQLAVYQRMNSIGWYFVVSGPESVLLARIQEKT